MDTESYLVNIFVKVAKIAEAVVIVDYAKGMRAKL
jgi:hypothetical protein